MNGDANTTDIRWIVDVRTRIVRQCSAMAASLWGYAPEEMVGLNADTLIEPDERERARQVREDYVTGDIGVWNCVRKDGSSFRLRMVVRKGVHNGRLCSFAEGVPDAP